jgi:hypothetical protein
MAVAALGALPALGLLPAKTFPILPAYKDDDNCADDSSWSYTGAFGETKCDDWYGFHCNENVATRCGESAAHLEAVIENCQETCDLCEKGISVHGDPMFRAGDVYTKLVVPQGMLLPMLAWNTSDGTRIVLQGATVSAGDDDKEEKDAQWFTHFRIEANETTVMDVTRVVPAGQLGSKMRVALDQKEIPAALEGVSAPEQHNSANRVVGLKLGTMGKRYIGINQAERLVLSAGGVPMEITSKAARKFKSKELQIKFAHFNLHIDKLPAGAHGLIAELKGMQPISDKSMSYLRKEPHYHVDASKNPRAEVDLRQKARKEKHNEYEGLCPGQDSLPPAPPYPPSNLAPLSELESLTPLPTWCEDTALPGSHDTGHPIRPATSDWGHGDLVAADIKYCEQAPNDYTCRQCCDFGLSGPKSVCSSGNRCAGDKNNAMWESAEGCGAEIGVTFMHEGEGTETEICVQAAPVASECIRVFNILEYGLEKSEQDECLAMIDKDSVDELSDQELNAFANQYPQGLKQAIGDSRQALEDAVEATADSPPDGPLPDDITQQHDAPAKGKVVLAAEHRFAAKQRVDALRKAMHTVDEDMHAHHAWQALVSIAKRRRGLPHDYKTETLDVQVKTDFGKASMTDVNAVKTLLAAAPVPMFCEGADCFADKVRFCVNLNAVKFLIEEVSHLVDMCVKPAGYLCAPPSFCNSEACGKTENRIMLTACLKSQPSKKFELAAFVQHGPGRNASFSGCEAAEYALKAYPNLPENAHPEDYLTMMRGKGHTVVNKEPIVKGLRSMLQARKESRSQ